MAIVKTDSKHYSDIAAAIRTNSGETAYKYKPAEMAEGVSLVYEHGSNNGYDEGYGEGYTKGEEIGYGDGYDEGYDDGAAEGYNSGRQAGYTSGYSKGKSDGYDEGYIAGVEEAGVSVTSGTITLSSESSSMTIPELIGKTNFAVISESSVECDLSIGEEAFDRVAAVICVDGVITAVHGYGDYDWIAGVSPCTVGFYSSSGRLSGGSSKFSGTYKYTIFE